MDNRELDKLTTEQELEMLKEITKNYNLKLPEIEPIYENGKIQNEKEIKTKFKEILLIISTIWLLNYNTIKKHNKKVEASTYAFYNIIKSRGIGKITVAEITKVSKDTMSSIKWNKIINASLLKRENAIKIKQVMRGNVSILNKQLQKAIITGYKTGKTKPQIAKQISEVMGYNQKKAKSIALTEINYHKSEAQIQATEGLNITKTWIHNAGAKEPRESHMNANGQTVRGREAYFNVGGKETQAPQHFGIASEDINCRCTMRIEVKK